MKNLKLFTTKVVNGDNKASLAAWGMGVALFIIVLAALHLGGCVDLSQLKK